MAEIYKIATGWLGWPPETAWHTPVPEILLAQEGLIEWTRKVWGAEEPKEPEPDITDKLKFAFRSFKRH